MTRSPDDVVIVATGETALGRLPDATPVQLQARAVRAALAAAGLTVRDVDGVVNLDPYGEAQSMFAVTLAEEIGARPTFVATVDVGGTVSGMTMVEQAMWAIRAGHCEVVVCAYGEAMLSRRPTEQRGAALNLEGGEEWTEPFGVRGAVAPYAMLAARYLHERGLTSDDLAQVAVVSREHAARSGRGRFTKPLTVDDYHGSPMVAAPLRMLDCSAICDGAGALVVTTRERAAALLLPPVTVAGFAMEATHNSAARLPDLGDLALGRVARRAFESAGVAPADLDVALIHDAFTFTVLLALEEIGLCAGGGGGDYYRSGAATYGGRCPVNTHGGLLSQGHIGGMLHLTEAVRQVQGTAGATQVPGVRHAVVTGNGGIFSVCGTMVLAAAR